MSSFQQLEVASRSSETQFLVGEKINKITLDIYFDVFSLNSDEQSGTSICIRRLKWRFFKL